MEIKITKSLEPDAGSCRCTKRLKSKSVIANNTVWNYPRGKASADKHLERLCNDTVVLVFSTPLSTKYKHT